MYGNLKNEKRQSGYTLIELVIVMGIIVLLFGFTTINLGGVARVTSVNETVDLLTADIRGQQTKAMTGSGDGTSGSSYGIYFQTDQYTLFRGTTYSNQ
ncbi:MAG: prepilin-type N-terminal cleavage/methylation domain-containing protein, partial [Patescibacteria group bacterium]